LMVFCDACGHDCPDECALNGCNCPECGHSPSQVHRQQVTGRFVA